MDKLNLFTKKSEAVPKPAEDKSAPKSTPFDSPPTVPSTKSAKPGNPTDIPEAVQEFEPPTSFTGFSPASQTVASKSSPADFPSTKSTKPEIPPIISEAVQEFEQPKSLTGYSSASQTIASKPSPTDFPSTKTIKSVIPPIVSEAVQEFEQPKSFTGFSPASQAQDKSFEFASKKTVEYGDDFRTLEDCLKNVPEEDLWHLKTHIYGRPDDHEQQLSKEAQKLAMENNFVVKHYKFEAGKEDTRPARMVKVAAVQHAVSAPLTDNVSEQKRKTFAKVGKIIDAAAAEGVNVLCLQELWYLPYFFCTREKQPWNEFAEDAETGSAVTFLKSYAKKYDMVIVSPILERDESNGDNVWNTAVVISNTGKVMGKSRKNHIPRENDFNESQYYFEGNTGHRVFETKYGRIAIVICFGRHQPQNWMMYAANGAEIIFNPSAELCGNLSDKNWFIEGRAMAVTNSVYTCTINRVGTEIYPNEFTSGDGKPAHKNMGPHYGSSYFATPEGERCPGLPRDKDGCVIVNIDLNMCRQAKDLHCYTMCRRWDMYAKEFAEVCSLDFKPNRIKEQ